MTRWQETMRPLHGARTRARALSLSLSLSVSLSLSRPFFAVARRGCHSESSRFVPAFSRSSDGFIAEDVELSDPT